MTEHTADPLGTRKTRAALQRRRRRENTRPLRIRCFVRSIQRNGIRRCYRPTRQLSTRVNCGIRQYYLSARNNNTTSTNKSYTTNSKSCCRSIGITAVPVSRKWEAAEAHVSRSFLVFSFVSILTRILHIAWARCITMIVGCYYCCIFNIICPS